jgi:hypothetical protein
MQMGKSVFDRKLADWEEITKWEERAEMEAW